MLGKMLDPSSLPYSTIMTATSFRFVGTPLRSTSLASLALTAYSLGFDRRRRRFQRSVEPARLYPNRLAASSDTRVSEQSGFDEPSQSGWMRSNSLTRLLKSQPLIAKAVNLRALTNSHARQYQQTGLTQARARVKNFQVGVVFFAR